MTGFGNDTIDGGEGYDVIQLAGIASDYQVEIVNGQLVLTNGWTTDASVTADNIEFVQFSRGSIAIVGDEADATALRLFQGLLGRDVEQEEAQQWLADAETGASAEDLATDLLASDEFTQAGDLSDEAFVDLLLDNVFGDDATDAQAADLVQNLANGADRATVAVTLVGSQDAAEHIDNVQVIDGLV